MADDDDPNRLKGISCTATLDYAARTLTFDHRGMFRSKAQKASPVIVPFDEIASVEHEGKWLRITRRGHEPWKGGVSSDPHGMNCYVDTTEFAQRVQQAVGIQPTLDSAERVTGDADAAAEPSAERDADGQVEPKPDGKVVKAVDGVLDFFSKFN
jgi:hypothetical protein